MENIKMARLICHQNLYLELLELIQFLIRDRKRLIMQLMDRYQDQLRDQELQLEAIRLTLDFFFSVFFYFFFLLHFCVSMFSFFFVLLTIFIIFCWSHIFSPENANGDINTLVHKILKKQSQLLIFYNFFFYREKLKHDFFLMI